MTEEKEKSLHREDAGAPFSKGRIKSLSTEPYKGVRDFYPEDMAVQNYIFGVWKKVAQEFGYAEYAASLLEPVELYRSKGNDEIVNEQMFTFTDRGDREVALRPEMTPSLARMIAAKRKSLKFPVRWFTIANCFRYERPQRGRRREHWQLNADVMGIAGVEAEVEIISLAYKIMTEGFGAKDMDFEIHVNDRKKLEEVLLNLIREPKDLSKAMRLTDARKKMDDVEFKTEWKKISDKPLAFPAGENLDEIIGQLKEKGVGNVSFDPYLTRGFDYYTGLVFEVFDTDPANRRSLFGGGRYDNLLELFGVEPVPTVGFGMGDITIRDFLETHNLPTK